MDEYKTFVKRCGSVLVHKVALLCGTFSHLKVISDCLLEIELSVAILVSAGIFLTKEIFTDYFEFINLNLL